MDRAACQASVHGVAELDTTEQLSTFESTSLLVAVSLRVYLRKSLYTLHFFFFFLFLFVVNFVIY